MKNKELKSDKLSVCKNETKVHPALQKYFGYCFFKAAYQFRELFNERISDYGLIGPQFGILIILSQSEPINQLTLGDHMAIDKATMVKMIDILEAKKWVKRSEDKSDRRSKLLAITEKGRQALEELQKIRKNVESEFFNEIEKKDREVLERVMPLLLKKK